MKIQDYLKAETEELYRQLSLAGANIQLEVDETVPCWRVEELPTFKITAPSLEPSAAAIAHELLHVKLSMQGYVNPRIIYSYFNETNSIFTPDFITILDNNVAHFKMIDAFLDMGFNVDEFLVDTPKAYFINSILLSIVRLQLAHKAGIANLCEETREIIQLVAGAKLFGLYKAKDPTTKNGLHEDAILIPLKEINSTLIEKLDELFNDWTEANTVNNLEFYRRLNFPLKEIGIPNAADCAGIIFPI